MRRHFQVWGETYIVCTSTAIHSLTRSCWQHAQETTEQVEEVTVTFEEGPLGMGFGWDGFVRAVPDTAARSVCPALNMV